jgi:uncharacterized membrane protein YeiB
MSDLFLFGGLGLVVTMLFPVVLLLALLVILALRHDDDVDSNRAPAIYGAVVAFVALLTLLVAATGVASSLVQLTASDDGGGSRDRMMEMERPDGMEGFDDYEMYEDESNNDDAAISSTIGFLIAGLAAVGLLAVHRSLFERRREATGAARRVLRAYALAFCLVVALIAMAAGGATLFTVWRAAAPGVAGSENRADELRTLVPMIVLFVGAALLWKRHWAEVEPTREEPTVTT